MKRRIFASLVAVSAIFCAPDLSASLAAEDHPGAVALLLQTPAARKELHVNSLQAAVLDSLAAEYTAEVRDLVRNAPSTPGGDRDALVQLTRQFNTRTLSVLSTSQRMHVPSIEVKALGASALFLPSVQKSLGLDATQCRKIEEIRVKGLDAVVKVNRDASAGKISPADRINILHERRMANHARLLALLTSAQRTAFAALGGPT